MPLLEQLLEQYPKQVKLVFKNFPLRMHQFALPAATAAMAANVQNKFWPFHDKLFENYNRLNDTVIRDIAKEVGLDMAHFDKSMKDPSIAGLINRDLQEGFDLQVRGTPTIFVNGKLLNSRSLSGFQQIIDRELKKIGSQR